MWHHRRDSVINLIRRYSPDLFGVQEARFRQMSDLRNGLYDYNSYGVGRSDGSQKGEFCSIFYRCDRFEWLEEGTFWLSDTGEIGEKGWDASCSRICTWIKLKDRETRNEICHFNTHLDHKGAMARIESANLILKKIQEIAGSEIPVILTGDFNVGPESDPYSIITNSTGFEDTKLQSESQHVGPEGTWSTFKIASGIGDRLDYIFIRSSQFRTKEHAHLTNTHQSKDKYYPSDHLPVLATLEYTRSVSQP
ncbi:hypothetical protein I4U23_027309 [Adineta vaga]|nr:hypothetical protein I4U23_027309 [Adineta vaga]